MHGEKTATLSLHDGKTLDFPVLPGRIGPDVIDMRALYGKTGMFTYDPGFMSTASCRSKITYIDGDEGILLYRGYPIEQLAEHCDFLEVCYLMLNGELPNASRRTSSTTSSRTTRWCTSSSRASTRASAATRTRWR